MLGNLLAALIGEHVDAQDGEGGALGAAAGVVTWNVAKRVVPAVIVFGGIALAARYLASKVDSDASA